MRKLIIAIDGPVGSGKSTVARRVAELLGYTHLDSGAMYRAVAWKALRAGVPLDSSAKLEELASAVRIDLLPRGSKLHVVLDGEDITDQIRTTDVSRAASVVAAVAGVRRPLVEEQRRAGAQGGVVMEGRDIGTVVFPHADLKIFLDASPDERARRLAHDPAHSGGPTVVAEVERSLTARDESDRTRAASPLYAADDAVIVDTTGRSIDEVVAEVLSYV